MGRSVSQVLSSSRVNLRRITNHLTTSLTNLLETTSASIRESTATINITMPSASNCSLCSGCFGFGSSRTRHVPEIIISENNMITHAITPEEITLSEEELEIKFQELVDELDLTTSNRNAMMSLPIEKKWQIYCSRRDEPQILSYSPEYYIDRVKAFMPPESPKLFMSLKTSLRTEPNSFVTRFLGLGGLDLLLVVLRNSDSSHNNSLSTSGDTTCSAIIGCLKSLLNNSTGRAHVLAHENALNVISEQLASDDIKCKVDVLEILGAVCLVPGGHRRVLGAMTYFQEWAEERTRFQTIICDLSSSIGPSKTATTLKTAIMSFLNAILSYGPGSESTEFRLHLRYELLMLGIGPTLEKLRKLDNATLDKHLDFFELMRNEDEKELARRLGTIHVDTTNTDSLFDAVKARWCHGVAYSNLTSIMNHLLNMKDETSWVLLDRLVQQLTLHPHEDRKVLDLDIDDLVKRLEAEITFTNLTGQIEALTSENGIISNKLFENERELEISTQEKERLETLVGELQEKIAAMEYTIQNARYFAPSDNGDCTTERVQNSNNSRKLNSIADEYNSRISSQESFTKLPKENDLVNGICFPPASQTPPPPPPPPMLHGMSSVPPPPPPMFQAMSTTSHKPRPAPPASSAPLKSFNWNKLPESKLHGTLWQDIKEEYDALDLTEVDRLFSAYQKNWVDGKDPGLSNTSTLENSNSFKKPILSLIDSRRAQNCTILLSKLKMTDDEICRAILSMDRGDQLHVDMVEQLMKFMPSIEERGLLEEQKEEDLARADGFLLKISRIPHYGQRLFTLHYKKRFTTITVDVHTKIQWVTTACSQLKKSRSLRKVLQIVLTLGNYMNRGQRGGACGFKISSLTRLVDTKSNTSGKGNLMNYLVGELEKIRGADIEKEIDGVKGAAKVSLQTLEKDLNSLLTGLNQIREEVEFQKTQPIVVGDRYLPVAREFLTMASGKVDGLEKMFKEMKIEFSSTVSLFGEEYTEIDEFFNIFDQFLSSYIEAKLENETLRKKKEEDEKKQATLRRPIKSAKAEGPAKQETKTEFDDLISALRTGDVFSDLSDTRKRSRVKTSNKLTEINSRERSH